MIKGEIIMHGYRAVVQARRDVWNDNESTVSIANRRPRRSGFDYL